MYIEKEPSFLAPGGVHRAVITDARMLQELKNGEICECLKVLTALRSAPHPTKEFMARMIYWEEDSRRLRHDLYEILGDGIENLVGGNGELDPDALQMLHGKECDIQIVHIPSPRHKHPFCKVVQIRAPGTLIDWPQEGEKAA